MHRLSCALAIATSSALSAGAAGAAQENASSAAQQRTLRYEAPRWSPIAVGPMAGRPQVADVNTDGHADIIVACGTCCGSRPDPDSGHVFVLLGDGAGNFAPSPQSPLKVGPSLRKLAVGDIDGDGHADIVGAEHDRHELTILLGDGAGAFARREGTELSVMSGPIRNPADGTMGYPPGHTHEVVLADVSGDDRLDILATTVSGHGIAVLLNDGSGSFSHATGSPVRVRTPYDAIAIADMNGDFKPDIVFPSIAGNEVNVMLGDGGGSFAHAEGSPMRVSERPGYAAAGDANGDGHIDVFVTHDDLTSVSVLLNDGTGKLSHAPTSPLEVPAGGFWWGIAPADLNGDGHLDLALGNAATDEVALLLGDGQGGFARDSTLKADAGAGYVIAADLNADGVIDLVTGNYEGGSVSVFLGQR